MSSEYSESQNKSLLYKFYEKSAEAIKEILQYPESGKSLTPSFDEYVRDEIISYLQIKGGFTECKIDELKIVCVPCPYHKDDPNDQYILNPSTKYIASCKNEQELESEFLTLYQIEMLQTLARNQRR